MFPSVPKPHNRGTSYTIYYHHLRLRCNWSVKYIPGLKLSSYAVGFKKFGIGGVITQRTGGG